MAERLEKIFEQLGERSRLVRKIDKIFDVALFEPGQLGSCTVGNSVEEYVSLADRYNGDLFHIVRRSAHDADSKSYPYWATQELDATDSDTGEYRVGTLEYNIDMGGTILITVSQGEETLYAQAPEALANRLRRAINFGIVETLIQEEE